MHWIRNTHLFRADTYECSNCGREYPKTYDMCPHCEARMKGTKYNPGWVDEAVFMDIVSGK